MSFRYQAQAEIAETREKIRDAWPELARVP